MTIINLSKVLSKYKKGWLALSPDNWKLIATGRTLEEALEKAKKKGVANPGLLKAAPVDRLFIGQMEFPYIKVIDFPKHQKRERVLPWILFGIFSLKDRSNILYPVGLIDSGSDITIIDHEFGEKLGIEIKKGIKDKVYGVGGGHIDIWFHKMGLSIHDGGKGEPIIYYNDFVAFTYEKFPTTMPQQTAILGTIGFFRQLDVTFKYPKNIFIEPKL